MTGCRRRLPNESGRGSALTVAHQRTHGPSRHSECRFCLCCPSLIVHGNTLHLNPLGEWRYIYGLADWYHRRENVIWEMSVKITQVHYDDKGLSIQFQSYTEMVW